MVTDKGFIYEKLEYCKTVCQCWSVQANAINGKTCFCFYAEHQVLITVSRKTLIYKRSYRQRVEEHYPPHHLLYQEFKALQGSQPVQKRRDYLRGNYV